MFTSPLGYQGPSSAATPDPTVLAAGDIACSPSAKVTASTCHQKATSNLLVNYKPNYVLPLGDNQYENGTAYEYSHSFDPTWGRLKDRMRPVPGNHEYHTSGASGYFDYFGTRAGQRGNGYYSYNVGTWHVIALNSSIGRSSTSPQVAWLKQDLASNSTKCTLVYWHHPRFSSGEHGNDSSVAPFWQVLYSANADVVLNGHDHGYERFAPQTPTGTQDQKRGMREFVVGTGGKSLRPFGTIKPNSQARQSRVFGVLELTLHASGYDWKFIPEAGANFKDSGWSSCH